MVMSMSKRKQGKRAYLRLPNGKDINIPAISSGYWEYYVLGVKAKSLKDLKFAIERKLSIKMIDKFDGSISILNYEAAVWDKAIN